MEGTSPTSAEEADADGTTAGELTASFFTVIGEGWLLKSSRTAESPMTQSGAAMLWMEAASAATNTTMTLARECFM